MKDQHQVPNPAEDQHRHYTLSISEEDRQRSFAHEDERWSRRNQVRDWLILGVAIVVWVAFQLSFYFIVPGIK